MTLQSALQAKLRQAASIEHAGRPLREDVFEFDAGWSLC